MKKILLILFSCMLLVNIAVLPASFAAPASNITVTWSEDNTSVTVTSDKDLSNVVVKDCPGVEYKYDNLNQGMTGTFTHPSGEPITTVWVKSGNNHSDDGPGYGERFDNPNKDVCGAATTTSTTQPSTTTTEPRATTTTEPGSVVEPNTTTTVPAPTETPKGIPAPAKKPAEVAPVTELPATGRSLALLAALGLGLVLLGALSSKE